MQIHPIIDRMFSPRSLDSSSKTNPNIKNNAIVLLISHENYFINSFLSSRGLKRNKNITYKTDNSAKFIV